MEIPEGVTEEALELGEAMTEEEKAEAVANSEEIPAPKKRTRK